MQNNSIQKRIEGLKLAKQRYSYNPDTGEIVSRLGRVMNRADGSLQFAANNKRYNIKRSHFAYFMLTDKIADIIIHLNGDKTDNRFWNLKAVPWEYKLQNQTTQGFIRLPNGKFGAQVSYTENGKRINKWLGCFETKEEARQRYLEEKERMHLEFLKDKFTFKEKL